MIISKPGAFFVKIDFENRRIGDEGNDCLLSVDGTYCPFQSTDPRLYSYKFKDTGLRYEVGLGIKSGFICWIQGPLPPGEYADVTIFRMALKSALDDNERVEADAGYVAEHPGKVKAPSPLYDKKYTKMKEDVGKRHETVNMRIKTHNCLTEAFRHSVQQHAACFRVAAILTQIAIEQGEPLFDVNYHQEP